jgi:hypothetical protein
MRLAAVATAPLKPELARQIRAGVVMDTLPQALDALETRRHFPSIPLTSLREMVKRDFCAAHQGSPV